MPTTLFNVCAGGPGGAVALIRAKDAAAAEVAAQRQLEAAGWWADDYTTLDVDVCEDQEADQRLANEVFG